MLLLDHICDQCNSLIIGKRVTCEECKDFDLCLMCSKLTDFTSKTPPLIESDGKKKEKNHTKEHKMSVNEPIIMVARPDQVTDAQVYLYLHSQFLFSILTLKLTELEASESQNCEQVKDLHSTCLNLILLMISKACT